MIKALWVLVGAVALASCVRAAPTPPPIIVKPIIVEHPVVVSPRPIHLTPTEKKKVRASRGRLKKLEDKLNKGKESAPPVASDGHTPKGGP